MFLIAYNLIRALMAEAAAHPRGGRGTDEFQRNRGCQPSVQHRHCSGAFQKETTGISQRFGGPSLTMALLYGSPALNAGGDGLLRRPYALRTDQRGFPRESGVACGHWRFRVSVLRPRRSSINAGADSFYNSLCKKRQLAVEHAIRRFRRSAQRPIDLQRRYTGFDFQCPGHHQPFLC